jgi:hypothetical protein
VAADLGTWPAEQATVLLEVLHTAGLHPEARRGRDGVHVTVPDDEGDRAHATLVAQMDTIAKAARPASSSRGRRLRAVEDPPGTKPKDRKRSRPARKPAASGRKRQTSGTASQARRFGRPAAVATVGFVAAVIIGGSTATFVLAVTAGALVWMLGKQASGS